MDLEQFIVKKKEPKFPRFSEMIIYEDDHLLIVNKPPYLPSLDERSGEGQSLVKMAKNYCETAILCHRLDRETSGVLVIAKDPETHRNISIQFEKRRVEKVYHAVVDGITQFDNVLVNLPIKVDRSNRVNIDRKDGKDATTLFNTIKTYRNFSLVECKPYTGRMHQIRVHLASQNATISGDLAYGGKMPMLSQYKRKYKVTKWENEEPIMKRFALHAYSIRINDNEGRTKEFFAKYPKDFEVFLKLIEKYEL